MGFGDAKKSVYSIPVADTDGSDTMIDYVFVDEHNRHKRLKGMPFSFLNGMILTRISHEGL